jgi:exodeoxyribonuclease-3
MKIISFNANSVRVRLHQLQAIVDKHDPEIIGLQETKVADEEFPHEDVQMMGYTTEAFGQKNHYGVALLSKVRPLRVVRGLPPDGEDAQRRFIDSIYCLPNGEELRIISAYFPQGESRDHAVKFPAKEKFYADVLSYLQSTATPDEHLVLMGDFNVAPVDRDIGIGEDNARRWLRTGKTSFLPEERAWLQRLFDWGLVDTYRQVKPDVDQCFSWFDYRSRGFEREPKRGLRIDHVLVSRSLAKRVVDAGIDYDIRAMQKPSDHCPVWVEIREK